MMELVSNVSLGVLSFAFIGMVVFVLRGIYMGIRYAYADKGLRSKVEMKRAGIMAIIMIASAILMEVTMPPTEEVIDVGESIKVTESNDEIEDEESIEEANEEPIEVAKEEIKESNDEKEKVKKEEENSSPPSKKEASIFDGYERITVDGGDQSGSRKAKVVVDIGFGDREYWAFTNEHGQLVRVIADEIILQDDNAEPVTSQGRYYHDEAKVPGTESSYLDEGHVIADSLGGVSNAYNITPQNSTLNRHGDQAYMERSIRGAGGAKNFEAIIEYPDANTQIPSKYTYTYTINGNVITDSFENINPDEENEKLGLTSSDQVDVVEKESEPEPKPETKKETPKEDVSVVDTNSNGKVTIAEAKEAGYTMPITKDHWLYKYMTDRDGDGKVGE